ncbi:MAG: penicillin-binding protein activator [Alphaproteobacteria bacterium]
MSQPPPVAAAPPPPAPVEPPPPAPPPPAVSPDLAGIAEGRTVVALLLPLSGASATFGAALLEAAQIAALDAGEGILVAPHDTAGTPEGAAAAAQAALDGGARIVLGPLFSTGVQAAAAATRSRGVPMIAFTNDAAVAGNGVWIMGLRPDPQVDRVVTEAAAAGLQRFAVLAPASAYGQLALQAAERVVPARGGQIVGVELYDPGGGDAQDAARRLSSSRAEAVLLADGPPRAAQVAPIYAYYEPSGARARFLGTALLEDPSMWREPALYGAWFAAPTPDVRAPFVDRFRSIHGRPPPRLATLAYDAVALAGALARQGDFSAAAIEQSNGFTGLDGLFRFRPDGTADRALAVMEIRRGQAPVVVRPAPAGFDDRPS